MKNKQYDLMNEQKTNNIHYYEDLFCLNSQLPPKGFKKYINVLSKHPIKLSILSMTAIALPSIVQDLSIITILSSICYISGTGYGLQAALKMKVYNENPKKIRLSVPITFAIVAGLLIALPTFLSTGQSCSGFGHSANIHNNLKYISINQPLINQTYTNI